MTIKRKIDITYVISCLLFLAIAAMSLIPSMNSQIILLLIGSIIVGLPHGAMDYEVGKYLGLCNRISNTIVFFTVYILIAALNFGLWLIFPTVGFIIFLALSIFHFGEDWLDEELQSKIFLLFKKLAFSGAFLSLPSLLNSEDLTIAFSILIPESHALKIISIFQIFSYPLLFITLGFIIFECLKKNYLNGILSLCFVTTAVLLPPVLFLFLYFCILHSPRHVRELYIMLNYNSFAQLMRRNIFTIALTFILLLLFLIFYDVGFDFFENTFSTLIILIACLTTPHMLLIAYVKLKNSVVSN